MESNKAYMNDHKEYTSYVHGHWMVHLADLRERGLLKQGSILYKNRLGEWWRYKGEIDENGKCYGYGVGHPVATMQNQFEGTWRDNILHGHCRYPSSSLKTVIDLA